jgi:probable rRNA maturation factor
MNSGPSLELYNRQATVPVDIAKLYREGEAAILLVLETEGPHESHLRLLDEVEVTFVDDATIARVHGEFFQDPSPTDVITFQHGEVLISAETGLRAAAEHGITVHEECLRYLVHGLLHLHGFHDVVTEERAGMHVEQERIVAAVRIP